MPASQYRHRHRPIVSTAPADRAKHLLDFGFLLIDRGTGAEQRTLHGLARAAPGECDRARESEAKRDADDEMFFHFENPLCTADDVAIRGLTAILQG